jgi:hypothetical protein
MRIADFFLQKWVTKRRETLDRLTFLREWFLHIRKSRLLINSMKKIMRCWACVIDMPVSAIAMVNSLNSQIAKSCSRAIRLTFILDILRQQTSGTATFSDRNKFFAEGHTIVKRTQLLLLFFFATWKVRLLCKSMRVGAAQDTVFAVSETAQQVTYWVTVWNVQSFARKIQNVELESSVKDFKIDALQRQIEVTKFL